MLPFKNGEIFEQGKHGFACICSTARHYNVVLLLWNMLVCLLLRKRTLLKCIEMYWLLHLHFNDSNLTDSYTERLNLRIVWVLKFWDSIVLTHWGKYFPANRTIRIICCTSLQYFQWLWCLMYDFDPWWMWTFILYVLVCRSMWSERKPGACLPGSVRLWIWFYPPSRYPPCTAKVAFLKTAHRPLTCWAHMCFSSPAPSTKQ